MRNLQGDLKYGKVAFPRRSIILENNKDKHENALSEVRSSIWSRAFLLSTLYSEAFRDEREERRKSNYSVWCVTNDDGERSAGKNESKLRGISARATNKWCFMLANTDLLYSLPSLILRVILYWETNYCIYLVGSRLRATMMLQTNACFSRLYWVLTSLLETIYRNHTQSSISCLCFREKERHIFTWVRNPSIHGFTFFLSRSPSVPPMFIAGTANIFFLSFFTQSETGELKSFFIFIR